MNLDELLALSEDGLFVLAGQELSRAGLGIGEPDKETLRERGRRWLERNRLELAKKLCNTHVARYLRSAGGEWDQVLLLAAVTDILSSANWGIGPATAAALALRVGLGKLCENC